MWKIQKKSKSFLENNEIAGLFLKQTEKTLTVLILQRLECWVNCLIFLKTSSGVSQVFYF